jgi:hypothetical protein
LGSDGQEDWIVLLVTRTRDSDALTRANFKSVLADLQEKKIEFDVHRFGHWGPGWVEIIVVPPAHALYAEKLEESLLDYPVFDEGALGNEENEDKERAWDGWIECKVGGPESESDPDRDYRDLADLLGVDLRSMYDAAIDRVAGGCSEAWDCVDGRAVALVHTTLDNAWNGRPVEPRAFKRYVNRVQAAARKQGLA